MVTAQFRTRQNNTVILSTVYNTTYLEIVLQDGRVWVRYNLAENMTGIVDTGKKYHYVRGGEICYIWNAIIIINYYKENNTWLRGNTIFISSVEHNIISTKKHNVQHEK